MWSNKSVIITGSGMGIGFQLATEIAKAGGMVTLNDVSGERLETAQKTLTEQGGICTAFVGDVTNPQSCKELVEHSIQTFGKLDVLINNAGITAIGLFERMKPAVFRKVIEVNVIGASNMTYAALPYLKETRGSILFVSSQLGFHGMGKYAAYSTSKMALTALWESLRVELQDTGVHVGLAYVGAVENSKKKTFLSDEGKPMGEPPRVSTRRNSPLKVAHQLMRTVARRRSMSILTFSGRIYWRIVRFFPQLVHWVMKRVFRVDRRMSP
jgi:NAD(P)-dependent dehydrogenase (short-subunit alcohol dehydrogenase family)